MMATGTHGHEQMAALLQAERERAAPAPAPAAAGAEAAEAAEAAAGATGAVGEAEAEAGEAEAEGARYRAVVMFRPTGWTHSGATRPGGSGPRVWADNGGATRIYAVPYSEHSSFPELQALLTPTLTPNPLTPHP